MIKQSKTTIKELTAQYRAVLKHAFFAGIAAVAVISTANAADPVTMDDVINSAMTPWAEYADEADNPAMDTSGAYTYNQANGTPVNASGAQPTDTFVTKIEKTGYTVTSTAGTGSSTGIASYIGSGLSAATELVGEGDAATIDYSYYTYRSGNDSIIALGDSEAVFTDNVDISGYTGVAGDTISVTGGVTEPTVAYDKFSFSYGTKTYTLVNDTTVNDGESNILIESISNETVKALATSLSGSHANAQADVSNAQSTVNGYAATEANYYNIAKAAVAEDTALVKAAQTNYTGYETAFDNYHTAKDEYEAYTAYQPYAESLGKVIDDRSNDVVADAIVTTTDIETAGEDPAKIAELISDDKVASTKLLSDIVTEKEANMSEQLGYNVANKPTNKDASGSLVNALTMNKNAEGETVGTVSSVVGAINANTDAIAQVRSDATEAYNHAHNWAEYVMGVDVDANRETQLQTALSELAGEAGVQNIGSDNIAGALHELDVEKVNTSDVLGYDDGHALFVDPSTASDTKVMSANAVKAVIEDVYDDANEFLTKELGYDTKTTDAKTELTNVGFAATNFLGAVTENKEAIATETTRAQDAEATLQNNIDAEATARANADLALQAEINDAVYAAKAGDALTLKSANDYTDAQVDTLEKNVSGGVAAATALSAVEVSNVKKGEMSVGGGYGYYNGESAGAFGMAMGLSDNWSVNAGAGVASGDKTQVSFRAGTNYKFKLF